MGPLEILFFIIVASLAFANGANDNFKGVATLWGGGDLSYRQAWFVANAATLVGACVAVYLGAEVAKTFSGKGVVGQDVLDSRTFAIAFAAGAAATVFLATFLRYPISTTHSILGSLAGAGVALAAGDVNLQPLIQKGAIPLLMSPMIAAVSTFILWKIGVKVFKPSAFTKKWTVSHGLFIYCLDQPFVFHGPSTIHLKSPQLHCLEAPQECRLQLSMFRSALL